MAVKPLNSVAGFSVGEGTPANIILANGDITTTNFTTTGVSNLNAIGNVKITGGVTGQVIQTDGTGNLSFINVSTTSLSNGTSNIQILNSGNINFTVAGAANNIVMTSTGINVAGYGNFGTGVITGNGSGLTSINGANVTGQVPNALVASTVYTNAQPNITSVGTLTTLAVTGNISSTSGVISGNGSGLTSLNGSNVTGQVGNALVAGTVYTAAQPNITSVGTLTAVTVTGNVNAGNVITTGVLSSSANGTSINSGLALTGSINAGAGNIGLLRVGNALNYTDTNIVGTLVGNANSYVQTVVQNQNTGAAASADFIVSADVASNSIYGDFGINSSNFVGSGGPFDDANASYVYAAGGNLGIGTSTTNVVKIGTNNVTRVVIDATGNANFTGNITAPNHIANTGAFYGSGAGLTNIPAGNIVGTIANANYALYAGTVTTAAQPNITSVGTLSSLAVTGNVTAGNVTATLYGNGAGISSITAGNIIGAVASANSLLANVGTTGTGYPTFIGGALNNGTYYTHVANSAISANLANGYFTATGFVGSGSGLTAIPGSNVTGQVGNALVAGTVYTNAQPNITSVGTLTTLTVSGNATAGNLITGGLVSATGNVTGGNITTGGLANLNALVVPTTANITGNINALSNVIVSANVSAGNLITTGILSVTGNANVGNIGATNANLTAITVTANANVGNLGATGNITGGNIITGGIVSATGNVSGGNITTIGAIIATGNIQSNANIVASTYTSIGGNITIAAATGNNSVILEPTGTGTVDVFNTRISNVGTPSISNDAATKAYVDNAVSSGLDIHTAAQADSGTNLSATYANGGTTPTWTSITTNNTVNTGSAHGLSVNQIIVFGNTTNGITAGVPYFVQSIPSSTSITLSLTYSGPVINTLVNGTGLTITSLVNAGVGATLTSTGTGPLILNGYTAALNDRILVHGQTTATQNGIYYISQVGVVSSSPWILTRATDGNEYTPNSASGLDTGAYFLILDGTDAGAAYTLSTTGIIVFGTTSLTFAQFAQVQTYTAGTGLGLYGNNQFYIANTAVTSASYGNGDRIATFTVNPQGQLTAASNVVSAANAANLTGTTLASTIVTSSLTSLGTLGSLTVTGNTVSGNFTTTGLANVGSLAVTGVSNLGPVGNVTITGGSSGQFLQTNGSGTLSWASVSTTSIANGNSSVSIPSANGNVNVTSGGNATLVITGTGINVAGYMNATGNATAGNLITTGAANISTSANVGVSVVLGNSSVTTTTTWASVTTSSVTANQTISTFSVTGVTGVEFIVKGIDSTGGKYSISTIHAVTDGTNCDWVTYGTAFLNSYTGSYAVNIVGGTIRLQVTPSSSNTTVWTTQYRLI